MDGQASGFGKGGGLFKSIVFKAGKSEWRLGDEE